MAGALSGMQSQLSRQKFRDQVSVIPTIIESLSKFLMVSFFFFVHPCMFHVETLSTWSFTLLEKLRYLILQFLLFFVLFSRFTSIRVGGYFRRYPFTFANIPRVIGCCAVVCKGGLAFLLWFSIEAFGVISG